MDGDQDREVGYDWLEQLRLTLLAHARHRIHGRAEDAEDLVQETLIGLRRYIVAGEAEPALRTLAVSILDKRIASFWRTETRRRRVTEPLDDVQEWLEAVDHDHGWAAPVFDELERHGLLARLTPLQAEVYCALRTGQELAKVAKAVGITPRSMEEVRTAIIKKGRKMVMQQPQLRDAYVAERECELTGHPEGNQ